MFVASNFAQPIQPLVRVKLVTENSVIWHVEDRTEGGQLPVSHFHVFCQQIKRKRTQNDSKFEAMEQQNTDQMIALWQRNAENVYTFGKLKPFTLYEFRIVAANDAGTSVPVIVMQETTDNWVPPTPFGQYVTALTSTDVLVWLGGLINNRQQPQQRLEFDEHVRSGQTEHNSTIETPLSTIFHNLFDGFLIGSSAGAPLSCLSISAALLCKRKDFDKLPKNTKVRPGKSMKMNLVLHLVSALTCAIGFSSGLLIDLLLYDTMVKYGFACGSGMFFYFSAVCMLPEMNVKIKQQLKVSGKKAFIVLLVQMIGVVLGG
ncbi:hypothetical protein niasHT_016940 [Heterodera trifolii]|uniref:Fibronectin type-III domain-containing protein n=1 Tax=Heterodera trifolii TaxID=157864 RepID=A0ABD2LCG1_9BILA